MAISGFIACLPLIWCFQRFSNGFRQDLMEINEEIFGPLSERSAPSSTFLCFFRSARLTRGTSATSS